MCVYNVKIYWHKLRKGICLQNKKYISGTGKKYKYSCQMHSTYPYYC